MRRLLVIAITMLLASPLSAQTTEEKPAAPEPPKPEITRYKDWIVACTKFEREGETLERCEMQQSVNDEKSGQVFLRMSIAYRPGQDKPTLRIFAPLGVMLRKGLALQIDGGKKIYLPFSICVAKPPTCIVEGVMENDIISAMKMGRAGTIGLLFPRDQQVDAPVSWSGFTKALNHVKK